MRNFLYALRGLKEIRGTHFKIMIGIGTAAMATSWILDCNWSEKIVILVVTSLVLSIEIINTALERSLNFLHPNMHTEVRIIKDMCAGAVLLSSIFAAIVGVMIFSKYIW